MIHARSSNIGRHKPNYAILFCLLVVVGDLGLQIVPIRINALLSDNNVQNQKRGRPLVPITKNRQPYLINFDDINSKENNNNDPGNSKRDQSIIPNNNRKNWVTFDDDNPSDFVEKINNLPNWATFDDDNLSDSVEKDNNLPNWATFDDDNLSDSVDKDNNLVTWKDFGEINFDLDNENFNVVQIVPKSDESLIRDPYTKAEDGQLPKSNKIPKEFPKSDLYSNSHSDTEDERDTNGEQLPKSNQIPKEHQLPNKSEQIFQDDQISKTKEPVKDKQFLEENQVLELTTMLCQQKKIIENCYKIYNEGSYSGLTEEKQQELKKLVEDAEKIQVDFHEKVNDFDLPEPVEKFREEINCNLEEIKRKLSEKRTDLSAEYDQLEPAEMTVPIDYLERSKFWRFFSDHKKALIYGSIGVGIVGAVAAAIGGINYYKNKKLSGNIPEWEIDANEQWPTKPNKSSFTKKLVMVVGLVVLMAIILAVVAFFVLKTASKNSSANKRQQPQPQPNQATETPTDTNNANTNTTTGTENVDKTGAATGSTPATTTTTTNKTNKSKQSARKSTIKSDKKSARKSRLTKSNKAHGEKSKAKSTIQPAKSKGSEIGGQRRRSQAQPKSSIVAKSVIQISKQIGKPTTTKTNH